MKKILSITLGICFLIMGCNEKTQESKDAEFVSMQQGHYAKVQPVPFYNWSLERHLVIQLYNMRNLEAATHSVWRSNYGLIEGDCPSIGFGIPFDTSITNPLLATNQAGNVTYKTSSLTSIGQPEPNGIFQSQNTTATWVLCTGVGGNIEPVYVESKVTAYPYPLKVDYDNNRVKKAGRSTVIISMEQQELVLGGENNE